MADKHIFSPEPDNLISNDIKNQGGKINDVEQSVDTLMQKVKREIELTGIIITPESKKAMILYKGSGSKKPTPELYDSGSSISDYLLKEIFPNYVVIAQNNLEIKLGLFSEKKNRPEPLREMIPQNNPATINNGQGIPQNQAINIPQNNPSDGNSPVQNGNVLPDAGNFVPENIQGGNIPNANNPFAKSARDPNLPSEDVNPFVRAMQDAAIQGTPSGSPENTTDTNNGINENNMGGNPFLQAIKRARERQQSQQ
ncbi:MAG: hypothetical protein HQK67_05165 [Desulfamplus sp.]|nr:hypothetical protein [Desulfamplus sp.]